MLVKQKRRLQLNKLTYRQYIALVFILTKLEREAVCPTKDEIKKETGFSTDRMLSITLKALEEKGFLKFNGLENDPIVEITEETKKISSKLTDKLLITSDYMSYQEIKKNIKSEIKKDYLKFTIETAIPDNQYIKSLVVKKKIVNRWYELLEDFPPSLVWDKLVEYKIKPNDTVLDPCSGSGTTVTTGKLFGSNVIGIDINPVAAFASKVKTTWDFDLKTLKKEINSILNDYYAVTHILDNVRLTTECLENIPKMERYQWLKPRIQNDIAFVKERILEVENEKIKDLFLLALIEAAEESSNVSFCPGTSFYPFKKRPPFNESFENKLKMIYEDLMLINKYNLKGGNSEIYNEDMREMIDYIKPGSIDFLFTSPPYPNDLEYTRSTRLDLYLLDYVKNKDDITEIKKKMIKGSTKLIYNESNSAQYIQGFPRIMDVVEKLEEAFKDKNWGWDYPRMVQEYFGDIYLALEATKEVLKSSSYALYVVGDQTYKNILIPVGRLIVDIANKLNYKKVKIETFRVRRSTLHNIPLKEEIVILQK